MRGASTTLAPFSVTLKLDGQVVQTANVLVSGLWQTFGTGLGSRVTVSGPGPHSISLEVRSSGWAGADIFWADNFVLKMYSGPAGIRLCGL